MIITTEKLIQMLDLAREGLSHAQIAAEVGCAKSTVQYQLKKNEAAMMGAEKIIVLPDPHVPQHDKPVWDALLRYMRMESFDGWICLGDLMDFNQVSKWTKNNIRKIKDAPLKKDYDAANQWLDELQSALGPVAGRNGVLIEGNHDYRIEMYIDEFPQFEGLLEVPTNLRLDERGIKWVPYWSEGEIYPKGHAVFCHGKWVNLHHAKQHAEKFGTNVFYGHVHDIQSHSYERLGDDSTFVGQSLGCLCEYDQGYIRGARITKWQQGFGVFYFLPNGNFTYYVVRIIDGKFVSPEGTLYY